MEKTMKHALHASLLCQMIAFLLAIQMAAGTKMRRERFRAHRVPGPFYIEDLLDSDRGGESEGLVSNAHTNCVGIEIETADIAIIGAGMAGVSAARTIQDLSGKSFVLLEGQSRLGGRMRSHNMNGSVIEDGANWIDGGAGNPIFDIAMEADLELYDQNFEDYVAYDADGNPVDQSSLDARKMSVAEAYSCVSANGDEYWFDMCKGWNDIPDNGVFWELENKCFWSPQDSLDNFLEWFYFDYEMAVKPSKISLASYPEDTFTDFDNKSYLVTDSRGYEEVAKKHAEGIEANRIHLDTEVYEVLMESDDNKAPAKVRTIDRNTMACTDYLVERVISTVSIGVLQNKPNLFNPPLDMSNNVYSMALYLKVFYQFEEKFWTDDNDFFNIYLPRDQRGECHFWQSLDKEGSRRSLVEQGNKERELRGKAGKGKAKEEYKNRSRRVGRKLKKGKVTTAAPSTTAGPTTTVSSQEENIVDYILPGSKICFCTILTDAVENLGGTITPEIALSFLEPLKNVNNFDASKINPSTIYIPQWENDEWTYGSYENWEVGKTYQQFQDFIAPRKDNIGRNVVYLSGSATCLRYWGYVHGAYYSGIKSAREVLNDMDVNLSGPKWNLCDR